MKKLITLSALFIGVTLTAQTIPNAGFETWVNNSQSPYTYLVPQGWLTTDVIETFYAGDTTATVTQTTQSHTGQYAVLMQVVNSSLGFPIAGQILMASSPNSNSYYGFPINSRPAYLTGFYKFTSVGNDDGSLTLTLTKWNTTANKRDTLFSGSYLTPSYPTTYTPFSLSLTYAHNEIPDTARLQFGIVGIPNTVHIGTQFFLDDLNFSGNVPLGINQISNNSTIKIYPNPANNKITIDAVDVIEAKLFDILGKQITATKQNQIDVSNLPDGVYFVQVQTNNGISTQKIIVQH